jgi:hypothetical protein
MFHVEHSPTRTISGTSENVPRGTFPSGTIRVPHVSILRHGLPQHHDARAQMFHVEHPLVPLRAGGPPDTSLGQRPREAK